MPVERYYGLWMWLPELFNRMSKNGGLPCKSVINDSIQNTTSDVTKVCVIDSSLYLSSFYSALSNLPGNIFTILFIDKMGRNIVTCKLFVFLFYICFCVIAQL